MLYSKGFGIAIVLGIFCLHVKAQGSLFHGHRHLSITTRRPSFFGQGPEQPTRRSFLPNIFDIPLPTESPLEVPDGNLSCYDCSLDFRKGYESTHPCLGRHGTSIGKNYRVHCGPSDMFCKVERTEVNGMLILLTRECIDECFYGCRPKGFGISFDTCAECCDEHLCNDFYPGISSDSAKPGIAIFTAMVFQVWRRI